MYRIKSLYGNKSNYKRMKKEMMWARCLSKGANRIGSDILLGLYQTDEIVDALGAGNNTRIIRNEEDGMIESVAEDIAFTEVEK